MHIKKYLPAIRYWCLLILICFSYNSLAQNRKLVPVAKGWARNSINTVVFRKNSLTTFNDIQYIAFYNEESYVVIGKRSVGSAKWKLKRTQYKGNTNDAHNSISIIADGAGYLHMAWDHHNNHLNYCVSLRPGSLDMSEKISMTGGLEDHVTYPEFYRLPAGDLVFFYRDGSSGNGNLILNAYDVASRKWKQIQNNLIDGEGYRNAYCQACVDNNGTIQLSWTWRESPDVASNHDICYAMSPDGGMTWKKSTGEKYSLPITAATAEYAIHISQQSELINQTSMTADENGHPYIATYWRDSGSSVPQYHVVYKKGADWQIQSLSNRKMPFTLSGAGSKRIPISRPQIIVSKKNNSDSIIIVYRDEERGSKVSMAIASASDLKHWSHSDLTQSPVGSWEPTFDIDLWKKRQILNLFVQRTEQADGEGMTNLAPQLISVLEWEP